MFPEDTIHCVEFARDKFSKLLTSRPKIVKNIFDDKNFKPQSPEELKQLQNAVKMLFKLQKIFKIA